MRTTLLLLACFAVPPALAEPSRTVGNLMAEPVSLFDLGLRRIGEHVQGTLLKEDFPEVIGNLNMNRDPSAVYDWKSNRITLYGSVQHDQKSANPTTLMSLCVRVVDRARFILGYGEMGTRFRKAYGMEGLSIHFQHRGYKKKDEPQTLEDDLAEIISIRIISFSNKDNKAGLFGNSEQVTCTGKLNGSEVHSVAKPAN